MTLLPLMAQAAARLAATNVLPSPGSGLVMVIIGHGVSSRMTRRLVRSSRMDSAIWDWGACTMAIVTSPERDLTVLGKLGQDGGLGDASRGRAGSAAGCPAGPGPGRCRIRPGGRR